MGAREEVTSALRGLIEAEMSLDREDGSNPARLRYFGDRVVRARRHYRESLARRAAGRD